MSEKKQPRFANNPLQLAKAFGLPLSPNKKKGSLKIVAEWIADPTFPKKQRHGWLIEEVRIWKEIRDSKKAEAELPGLSNAEKLKGRLDYLEDWYFHPSNYPTKQSAWEVEELRTHRPYLWEGKKTADQPDDVRPKTDNDLCDTQVALAQRLQLHYLRPDGASKLKYVIDTVTVSDWRKNKRLDGNPPPPACIGPRRQYSLRAHIEWFDKYFWDKWKLDDAIELKGMGAVYNLQELKKQDEIDELEFRKWERQKELGKYIEVAAAVRIGSGQARQLADYWRNRNEQTMIAASKEKLLTLGVASDIVTIHTDWLMAEHKKFTDDVEAKAASAAEKYAEQLKAEVEKLMVH